MRRVMSVLFVGSIVVAGCGKTGGSSIIDGIYHLEGADRATSLEVRGEYTFAVRRDACDGIGINGCGDWVRRSPMTAALGVQDYWPTPDDFPSARVDSLTAEMRDGVLVVHGRNELFGSFTQRWVRGRVCEVCGARSYAEPCNKPMPAC
jgi:hypothetical protein